MTKNRTPTLVYLDPGMHPGLEVKGLTVCPTTSQAPHITINCIALIFLALFFGHLLRHYLVGIMNIF